MAFRGILTDMVSFQAFNGDRGEAYYAHSTGAGRFPGVVVIHHFPGWDEWTAEVARKFAHHGYASIAPNLYFRLGDGASEEVVARARAAGGMHDDQVVGDISGAVAFLRSQRNSNGKGRRDRLLLRRATSLSRRMPDRRYRCGCRLLGRQRYRGRSLEVAQHTTRGAHRADGRYPLPASWIVR
jgi:hypothetical protein